MNHYKEAIKIFRNENHETLLWLILQSNPGAIVNAVKPAPPY